MGAKLCGPHNHPGDDSTVGRSRPPEVRCTGFSACVSAGSNRANDQAAVHSPVHGTPPGPGGCPSGSLLGVSVHHWPPAQPPSGSGS